MVHGRRAVEGAAAGRSVRPGGPATACDGELRIVEMARARPDTLTPGAVLGLQRLAGNAATAAAVGAAAGLVVQRKTVCVPKAVDRPTFLAQGGQKNDLGLTVLSTTSLVNPTYQPAIPHPKLKDRYIISAKVPTLGTLKSIYTKPGRFDATLGPDVQYVVHQPGPPGCTNGLIPLPWNVVPNAEPKIAAAEKQHCDDFKHAWKITYGRFARAASALRGRVFRSPAAAEEAVGKKAGIEVKAWATKFETVSKKTRQRDNQTTGEHVPRIPAKDVLAPNRRPDRCLNGLFNITKDAFPLPPRKTVDLITW